MQSQFQAHSVVFSRRSAILAIVLLGSLPTIGVLAAAFGLKGVLGALVWAVSKVGLIAGPVLWWRFIQKQPIRFPSLHHPGLWVGAITGVLQAVVIIAAFWLVARPFMSFDSLQAMLQGVGLTRVDQYLGLALYLTLVNSLMEEYIFRWFFFQQFKRLVSPLTAVFLSAALFTLHHTVVLSAYVPWYFNVAASLGVFSGGLVWSYLYYRYGSIWPAYISHIGADIGVFVIGYFALF